MKVLMCGSALSEPGGMTSVCRQLVNHSWPYDIEVDYVATHKSGSPLFKVRTFLTGLLTIQRKIDTGHVDLVHIHMSYKGSFIRKKLIFDMCKRKGVPCLLHMHGSEFEVFFRSASRSIQRSIINMLTEADAVIALGERWRRFFLEIAPNCNVVTIRNAVAFHGVSERFRKTRFGVLFLGLLIPRKGVAELIKGFADFVRESNAPEARLLIAGSGPEEKNLKDEAAALGIQSQVEFYGWVDSKKRDSIMRESDVFVLPSYNEGLPVSLLEAMAVGLPPIVSDIGSVSEAVCDGVEGVLVEPGNVEDISSALTKLYSDVDFWRSCSLESMRKIGSDFNESDYFDSFTSLYLSTALGEQD